MWVLLRYFGLTGLRRRIAEHLELTAALAAWIDAEPAAERLADAPFGLVCFRWRPEHLIGREGEPAIAEQLDRLNERLMTALNADGSVLFSHTRSDDRFAIRFAIGNVRTQRRHVEAAWQLIGATARDL